jgi:hypothetical protein
MLHSEQTAAGACNRLPISVAIFAAQLLVAIGREILEGNISKSVNMAVSTFETLPTIW